MIWPADTIERRQVAQLTHFASNARTHSPEQIAQIAASIREWGWTVPVLVDEAGGIIAGHGRVLAAQRLGFCTIKKIPSTRYPPSALPSPMGSAFNRPKTPRSSTGRAAKAPPRASFASAARQDVRVTG